MLGLTTDLRLTERIGCETLLYQLDRRFTENGRLIFNHRSNEGRKSRPSIYAAFDYNRGGNL